MGFFHEGELFISGRCKDLIICRGRNFYPHDLEEAAADACPELGGQTGASFAVEGESGTELVLVFEVARDYKPGGGEGLFARIRERLAELFELELHHLLLVKVGSIPRASSGKVQRQECARRFRDGELNAIERASEEVASGQWSVASEEASSSLATRHSPLATSSEALRDWLVARMARLLKLPPDQIDADKPWSAYGMGSLALAALASDLQEWLGRPLSPTLLYSAPTVGALVGVLARDSVADVKLEAPACEARRQSIAVVGIGCRFPTAHGPDEVWQVFRDGRCVIDELPEGRWERAAEGAATTRGGYLADVACFDAPFFGIAPREAVFIDPQHRLLLETAWEALEHAGLPADGLAGRPVGVFVGASTNDYSRLLLAHGCASDGYAGVGNAASMAAHRLSYHLDLHGPSVTVDTACSSALVAIHLACQSLRLGECELALVGGVNLILTPDLTEVLSHGGMLSSAGLCKTFDAAADGYVRGEGCGVVVLKPLSAAVRDGDRILAVVEASAVNQDGKSNGITAPNGARQTELIRRVLRLAGRSPDDVSCIEAHGTGTSLGDPIEFDALQAALGSATVPCALSSVKTNLGHLEAAAGIAGLIKAVLQVHHGQIAPHLHLENLNPRIGLAGTRFHIPRELTPWPNEQRPRLAAVSSFGFGGTNAHVLVAQAPEDDKVTRRQGDKVTLSQESQGHTRNREAATAAVLRSPCHLVTLSPCHLLPLSAKSKTALRELARRFAGWLRDHPDVAVEDVCAAASRERCHFEYRLAVIGATGSGFVHGPRRLGRDGPSPRLPGRTGRARAGRAGWRSCSRARARSTPAWGASCTNRASPIAARWIAAPTSSMPSA